MEWTTIASAALAVASPLFAAGGAWAVIEYRVRAMARRQDAQDAEIVALRSEIRARDAEERQRREAAEAREREALAALERALSDLRLMFSEGLAEIRADVRVLAVQRGAQLDEGSAPKKRG